MDVHPTKNVSIGIDPYPYNGSITSQIIFSNGKGLSIRLPPQSGPTMISRPKDFELAMFSSCYMQDVYIDDLVCCISYIYIHEYIYCICIYSYVYLYIYLYIILYIYVKTASASAPHLTRLRADPSAGAPGKKNPKHSSGCGR